jgi:hypothetical protein
MCVWAAPGGQQQKKKENQPPPKPQVQQQKQSQSQQPKAQPQYQQPKPKPQYQQATPKPQSQQPKPKPQYQQATPKPQYQQPTPKPQYQQAKPQPQYQQPKGQPQYQQPRAQPQYQQQRAQPQYQKQGQLPQRPLTSPQSRQQIQNLNRNRGMMTGINRNPLPQGQVMMRPDGGRTISASGGRQFEVRRNGTIERVSLSGGRSATFRPNGSFASVHAGGMRIDHGLRGERRIVTERPDHSRVVSMGPRRGYLERPYIARGGRTYVQRTYYVGGRSYVRVYRTTYYRGVPYYHYVPAFYFHPRFYGWVYNPWRAPVYYRWAWFAAPPPWYSYYGGYFAPAPVYPSAAFWLTDFLLAESLRAAYEAGREAEANAAAAQANQPPPEAYQPPPPAPQGQGYTTQITPEMKAAIAEEVRQQLAAEQQSATTVPQPPAPSSAEAPPGALDPARRLFVVSGNLAAPTVDGQDCELTAGDIITRLDDTPDNNNNVRVSVSSSKGNDCRVGSTLMVGVSDLQDMQNQFREQMDSGLKTLADNSGKGGLPPAPDTGTSAGEVPPPPPDANVDSALQAQQQAANQTEAQIQQEAAQGGQNNQ